MDERRISFAVKDLSVDFNGFKAVNGMNLSVYKGELRVLLGANGAGKTTLMDLISGRTKSTGGKVLLNDKEITNWEEHLISRAGIGRKFQIPNVFKELTVRQNFLIADCKETRVLPNIVRGSHRELPDHIARVVELTELYDFLGTEAATLSHGQTQWLEIGMLLVQNPDIILLDEPTAGMTAHETRKTAEIITRLKGRHTILVVEHDMAFVRSICETITVMHHGQNLAEGTVTEIENSAEVQAAYLGSAGIGHA
ncbi:urea ABC transporter ATP-binding protein UrtD [Pontibaca salina]|uniref:Urea ABC transporter ATP-binding protein UrtD n=1 Tax=Pontibaca salina TaxID=2795731 RepID=A0A934HUT7_9RHOB|nr:urea ABC transporter ATP-binding protein UrtD [Pontibaca salina]MBI6629949.1 urea ABC transporter ATP-binding protein UrtD [Pontibaca salina]